MSSDQRPLSVVVRGGGIAGQVLHRELWLRGIPCRLEERARFPREKVCGGILQWDSWEYLNSIFEIHEPHVEVTHISHHWKGRRISRFRMPRPMASISRLSLDACLNAQQRDDAAPEGRALTVDATGAVPSETGWLGFQAESEEVGDLEMHYSSNFYLGRAPVTGGRSQVGMLVRKSCFRDADELRRQILDELGISLGSRLRGTPGIRYGHSSKSLAIGDARLTTHPFLGLGMKHAILSARVMAEAIGRGEPEAFDALHREQTAHWHFASRTVAFLYGMPLRVLLRPLMQSKFLFMAGYRWLHGSNAPEEFQSRFPALQSV